jgi:hypothetical protein
MEPDMEDLSAIIPITFDFVDEMNDILGEDEQQMLPHPSFGKS